MSNMAQRLVGVVLASVLVVSGWGCGTEGSGTHATLIPVKGKVTYKGQPVAKGTVKCEPDDVGRPARGELQSDGTYVLGTFQQGDGVIAGHHQVSIGGTGSKRGKELIPKKYTQRSTSKLTADVDAEHAEHNFELRDGR
jgi:hypothetical protein